MSNTVSERVLLQEAIVAAWAKEGRDVSMQFTLAGIAADVAMAALSARVAKLEAALRFILSRNDFNLTDGAKVMARAALEEKS